MSCQRWPLWQACLLKHYQSKQRLVQPGVSVKSRFIPSLYCHHLSDNQIQTPYLLWKKLRHCLGCKLFLLWIIYIWIVYSKDMLNNVFWCYLLFTNFLTVRIRFIGNCYLLMNWNVLYLNYWNYSAVMGT